MLLGRIAFFTQENVVPFAPEGFIFYMLQILQGTGYILDLGLPRCEN